MQNLKIWGFLLIFISIAIVVGCEKANDIAKSTKDAATKAQHLITAKAVEVSDNAMKVADNAKHVAVKQIDKVSDQITTIVNETTNQVISQIKAWIYEIMRPVFPWLFIIFFLLLFVALKFAIPLSNFTKIQLAIAIVSYAVSFWIFYKIGLLAFAVKGSLWFLLPIMIIYLGFWLKGYVSKPKIFGPKKTAMSEAVSHAG